MTYYEQEQNALRPHKPIRYPSPEWFKKRVSFDATDKYHGLKGISNEAKNKYKPLFNKETRGLSLNKEEEE
jgi:hypothetical protein